MWSVPRRSSRMLDEQWKKEEESMAALQREFQYTPEKKAWVLARGALAIRPT